MIASSIQSQSSRVARRSLDWLALLLFFVGGVVSVHAQQPTANALAKRVDDHYNHLQSLKTNFSEEYAGLGMQRSESGTLLLRKPGRMRWEYASTPGKVFVLDGKYAWFYAPGDTQVQRIQASQLDDLRSPLRFLLGHTKLQAELQNLTIASAANGEFTLTGQPKGQQQRIAKLSMTVTASGSITGILMQEIDGAETRFHFTNEDANAAIPENTFRFTPPKGVPVVDALPPV